MPPGKAVLKKDRLEEERELLRRLLEKEGLGAPAAPTTHATQDQGPLSSSESSSTRPRLFPLSCQQEQLWFLDRFEPSSDFYNVALAWRLKGDLDVPRLERSLQEVMRRHEILRTCFVLTEDEEPRQKVVEDGLEVRLQAMDLRKLEPAEREEQAEKIVAEAIAKPFDLRRAPLFRGVLARMEEREHVLGLTLHHIICDEWSVGVLVEELEKLYEAYGRGEESPLPELGLQYGEYALEQREALRGEKFQEQMEYWKRQLNGMPQVLELPTDRVRQPQQSFRGKIEHRCLGSDLLEGLNKLGRGEGASFFMTLLAAYQVLLTRYSGQEDFGVGTSITNRSRANTHGLIGYFLNTLVIRAKLGGSPTFREVLRQVRQTALDGYEHQDLPFEKVVEELTPDRDLSRSPMIQVMFTVNKPTDSKLGPFEMVPFQTDIRTSKFDLTMFVEDSKQSKITFNYSTDLFEAETIARMLGHYERLLKAVVENPEQRVWELPLLTDQEKHQLEKWNQTDRDYPHGKTIAELFEEHAARTPNAVAVEDEEKQLTYEELNRKANRLAHYLRELGMQAEQRVAICLDRSIELVIAELAILKCGAAYVPIDPSFPDERKTLLIGDSQAHVLLTLKHTEVPEMPEMIRVNVDLDQPILAQDQSTALEANLGVSVDSEATAYIMYTSGSTGTPKGVMVPHRAVQRLVLNNGFAQFQAADRVALAANPAFDATTLEVWAPLLNGARIVVVDQDVLLAPARFGAALQQHKVSILWLTVGLFNQYAERLGAAWGRLRYLIVGGDVLDPVTIQRVLQNHPPQHLLNGYGPTETTTFAATYEIREVSESQSIPIGRPIGNTRVYVLDRQKEPAPVGVPGELYIGGAGVALGYLNRPELTAERFLRDPFVGDDRARMYRTGDLGRWLPDGTIEFIGRNDSQVKIRGYRVELGEIEAMLQQQSGVQGCAVVAKTGGNGSKRLVAYVVGELDREELRRNLKGKLPSYMIPSVIVALRELPLSNNGKLDRQALAEMDETGWDDGGEIYEPPRAGLEEELAKIWIEVLAIKRVGRNSNFFDLGGHSLLATSLVSRFRNALGVEVSVRVVFESPTIAELADEIELRLKSEGRKLEDVKGVRPGQRASGSRPSLFPLSYQQQQLWFLDRFQPGSDFYNVPVAWKLKGDLDVPRLERSLQEVVRRHEILRTCFVMNEDEEPQQRVVGDGLDARLPMMDLRDLEPAEREEQAKKIVAEDSSKPFDLNRAPLFRGVLVRMGEREHVLGLTLHHIICDEWSLGILVDELGKLYEAYGSGEESPLPELGLQYGEYALDQREALRGEKFQQQMEYWKRQLNGMPQVLELPADHVRQAQQSFRGRIAHRRLASELLGGVNELARSEGASFFMTLLAAYQVVLMRYSGLEDFGVGTSIANRSRIETHGLIGFFLNTLVIRAKVGGRPTFRELLRQVRQTALDGYEHQDLPFEKLVEELAPDRDMSRNPVIQVLFTVNQPVDSELGPFELSEFEADIRTSKFDLAMLVEDSERAKITLNYSTDLFEAETIGRMLGHYERLLKAVVKNPERRVWELPLLTDQEKDQLEKWNQTDRDYARETNVAELFEACAASKPNAVAVEYEEKQLTYGELNRRANRLAHFLRELGVQAEQRVAICVERGFEMVVGLLAVLKAGGAYVPMDPEYPQEHLRYILQDSAAVVLLTQGHLQGILEGIEQQLAIVDVNDTGRFSHQPEADPQRAARDPQAGQLAYLIYTSGSTGRPKGVMVSHQNLVSSTFARKLAYGESGRFLLLSSISFDSSVAGIFGSLIQGDTLVIATRDVVREPLCLNQEVQRLGVESLLCVPSLYKHFLEYPGRGEQKKRLSRVIVAGEVCPPDLVAESAQQEPQVELINEYGPTEGTVWASMHRCAHPLGRQSVPIGRPIANSRVYILDAWGEPVPVGVAGELYIGGAGVARGYWCQPELTAERFVPDSHAGDVAARMYKTGDLGRWLPDGTIEFIGRNDSQVKIRGYRVELGEIEAMLLQQTGVRSCAVVAKTGANGSTRLVAYVVGERDRAELRRDLKGKLPAYMIPSVVVALPELPLSNNGKVDRQALSEMDESGWDDGGEIYEPPRAGLEEELAKIWIGVLEITRVGRHDNFFDLGGHSLLATSMISRFRSAFGEDVPVRAVFESPTIAELAETIEHRLKSEGRKLESVKAMTPTPAASGSRPSLFPLSYQQEQLWFLDQFQPSSDFYNVPLAWKLKGDLDVPSLERGLQEVVRRHEILRTCFVVNKDQEPRQKVVREGRSVRLPVVDLQELEPGAREEQAKRLVAEEGAKPFDLSRAPLLRGVLVRTGEREHVLGLTLHHILCDDWSLGVLMAEFGKAYEAYGRGEEPRLPELEMQYGDYALEQRVSLQGGRLQQQMEYWKKQLEGMPQVLELPTDLSRPARQSFRGGTEQRSLGSNLIEGLNVVGREERTSLFMTLLAVWQVLLMRYSGQEDFAVGTPVANRKRLETERMIGFFLNTLVIRANLRGEPTFREVLRRVRSAALAGYEHQDLSFEKLVEALTPDRDVSRSPIFQVMFTTLDEPGRLEFGELELNGFAVDTEMSKFDLTMSVAETRQGAAASINYTTDLFEADTIQRMLGHYEQVLKAVVENPERRVWHVPLLTQPERAQLEEWNQTASDYRRDKTIAGLFEEHAARTPHAVAVEYEGQKLEYGDLNRQANRLAHHLRGLGVQRDTRVAICVERSLDMIVGLLAVMKAGGGYVALDPAYPEDRLRFMLEDSSPAVLLTQGHLRRLFTGTREDLEVMDLGAAAAWSRQPDSNPDHTTIGLTADDLVYVIYTSGSTGKPKGVAMPARAAMNLVAWQMNESKPAGPQRTLQFAALGFDVSFQEIFSTLCAGGILVLIAEEKRRNSTDLTRYVIEKGIQRLFLPYVGLQMLAEGLAQTGAAGKDQEPFACALQEVNVAGEQLRIDDKIRQLFKRLEHCRLNNHYGPTETHAASAFHLGTETDHWPALPPIGRPIANAQIYILDKHEQFVPLGVAGEVYIGGAGVARGYLNRPELTAQRFLKNRFAKEEGGRLYRTGDLGRWRPDGTIEFLGRNDSQVKIRGYRVELGEIEAMLQQQSGVRGCAVVAKTGANGGKRLVAYVVGERDREELRRDLKGKLPAYMIPSVIVGLQELPMSSNGKVDRDALEKLEDLAAGGKSYEAPRTPVEEKLAEIWVEALEVTRVGRHDNYFDLGGHSLLASLTATRMENTFGIDIPVRALFESPTIAELAEVIELGVKVRGRKPGGDEVIAPTRLASGSRPSLFPLSYQQEQLWFLDRLNPANAFYNVPMTWRLKGDLDVPRLERSLQEVVRRHEVLRTCFVVAENEVPRQKVVGEDLNLRLPVTDLREVEAGEREDRARKIVAGEGSKPFDLSRAPLLRGVLVRTEEREHIFGLTLHHIVCDDWSLGTLMEEFWILYEAYGKGQESPLPELEMQYGEYALEQRERLSGGRLQQQMEYWKRELEGMPQVLELPTDLSRPARQSFGGGTEHRFLQRNLLEALNAMGRGERASLLMVMLAAYAVLLMRYSGQDDFGVGTVVANRRRQESKGLVGFFLSTLVIRAKLGGEPTFREVLRRVREAVLGGYEHQDLPFEKVVEELAPHRDVSRSPMFQVAFTLRRTFAGKSELKALELIPYALDPGTSKFDLILSVEEGKESALVGLNYTTDVFESETVRRMLRHYERLLEGIVADADQPVWALPMISELDEKVLSRWNRTGSAPHPEKNLIEILDAQAERQPQESAVIFGEAQLSHGELNRRANQLGHYLAGIGVGPESLVGIFISHSPEMVVAMLGVLKAGGGYLLVDVQNPKDRLRSIIQNSDVAMLLTLEGLRKRLPQTNARVLCLDSGWEAIGQQTTANPQVQINPQNLACVIYTGASEEHGKGWMVEHNGLLDLASTGEGADPARQNGHVRDNGLLEIWPRLSTNTFLGAIAAFLTPVAEGERARFKPRGNADIYLLDSHLQQVGIGVPGELWISGPALGRGYLRRPSLTAEKFLPNPFTSEMGARMCGTGERARYRNDGVIELMGRLDDRVEINGFPVEPGEIEATLANYESVQEAAVVVRPSGELVAYVVVREGRRLGQNDLRNYLDDKLPSYMIPNSFITLQKLPHNAQGEVDRTGLSVLGQEQLTKEFVPPRTELEQTIAAAWQTSLGVDQVGVHDNFFDLGGHSLLMIRLHQKLRAELGVEIELLHLFQFPTIDSLVRFLHTGYNFDEKSRETQDRAKKQKSAVQKLRRMHTP